MFDRISTMIAKDLRTGSRDQITLYLLLSPLLLGAMLTLILPLIEDPRPVFVLDEAFAQAFPAKLDALAAAGEIEQLAERAAVEARVLERDDATGVVVGAQGLPELLVEGDEPAAVQQLPGLLLAGASPESLGLEQVHAAQPGLRELASSLVAYTISVMVGLMLGFSILEEKTSGALRAYAVSPLRFGEYLGAKLLLGAAMAVVMVVPAIALPMGLEQDWLALLLCTLSSLPFALCLGLIVGALAKDQVSSVGLMKGLLPVWTSLPILGFVLPDAWMWTQYPFANHWGVQAMFASLSGQGAVAAPALASLAAGIPVLVATALYLRSVFLGRAA